MSQPSNRSPDDQTPRPPAATPVAVTPLDYQTHPEPDQKAGLSEGWQLLAGMGFFYVYTSLSVLVIASLSLNELILPSGLAVGLGISLIAFISIKSHWRAFIPGILCAILSLPLIGLILCGILLSGIIR